MTNLVTEVAETNNKLREALEEQEGILLRLDHKLAEYHILQIKRDGVHGLVSQMRCTLGMGPYQAPPVPTVRVGRQGRKSMPIDERKQVSQRMKRYWSDQRTKRATRLETEATLSVPPVSGGHLIPDEVCLPKYFKDDEAK